MPIVLRAGFGQEEINHGIARYRVDGDSLLSVPARVALHLLKNAGFYVVQRCRRDTNLTSSELASQLLVRIHHATAGVCSYGGREYRADENGDVLVPAEAVADLTLHGFVPILPEESSKGQSPVLVQPMPAGVKGANSPGSGADTEHDAEPREPVQ